jgi:hypothetical protein
MSETLDWGGELFLEVSSLLDQNHLLGPQIVDLGLVQGNYILVLSGSNLFLLFVANLLSKI